MLAEIGGTHTRARAKMNYVRATRRKCGSQAVELFVYFIY